MPLTAQQESNLFELLTDAGWRWEDEILCAPYGSIWLLRPPWEGDLADFHERMVRRAERIERNRELYDDVREHNRTLFDTLTLVQVLHTLREMNLE